MLNKLFSQKYTIFLLLLIVENYFDYIHYLCPRCSTDSFFHIASVRLSRRERDAFQSTCRARREGGLCARIATPHIALPTVANAGLQR